MRPWRASLPRSKQSGSMRPGSAPAPRRGRRCSSTSKSFTIGSACTRPWATEPRPRLAPAWRRSPCARQHNILISSLHTKGGGPSGQEAILAAAEHQPDLMLVDGDLKGEMDGIAAAVEIHNRLGIRSIVLAEQCDRTVRARAAEALPVAILDKTSPMSAIADALRMGAKHHHRLALLHHNATLGDAHSPA